MMLHSPVFLCLCFSLRLIVLSTSDLATLLEVTGITATQQHSFLNKCASTELTLACSPHWLHHTRRSTSLFVLILLAGDIELNPGPNFNICTINVRSLLNPIHKAAIFDLASTSHPDVFALSGTWIRSTTTPSDLGDATPLGYSLLSLPRSANSTTVGGGFAFLV
jgi:hypothetical protein